MISSFKIREALTWRLFKVLLIYNLNRRGDFQVSSCTPLFGLVTVDLGGNDSTVGENALHPELHSRNESQATVSKTGPPQDSNSRP
ncbi:hypothetical protein QVD17_04395 [Tagetes erecta]|uniref:Uncharacterized protein n=1 Tax=Tagetes erecta TaxID=13708 RepID=A0AAD8PAP1_TARER|nr:hypothetical protein QVD17_04395 [Tagetes erecta]